MGKKHRSAQEKLKIVLEGLENGNIAETCREHGIHESQFYQWKNKLEESAPQIFSNGNRKDREKKKLHRENERLQKTIVELSCELQTFKKNDV